MAEPVLDEDGNCIVGGLPPEMCAHCRKVEMPKPIRTGAEIEAQYGSTCMCGCDDHYSVGTKIAYSNEAGGWCIASHLTAPQHEAVRGNWRPS